MKTQAILAALVLAAPATSLADPRCFFAAPRPYVPHHFGGFAPQYRSSGYCAPRPFVSCAPTPFLSYAPQPFVSLSYVSSRSFVSERPIYRASRYYEADDYSYETDVQRALKRRGYYYGDVDGDIGPRSRAAIREYQADHGLAITGRVDGSLLRSLGI